MAEEVFMDPEERNKYIADFLDTSRVYLETLNEKLLVAKTAAQEGTEISTDDLDSMIRAAHTLKGSSAFLSLNKMMSLAHELEAILKRIAQKEITPAQEVVDVLLMATNTLEALFCDLGESREEKADIDGSVRKIQEISGGG